ncbi:MAG: hypothetical protein AAFX99_04880 [Myxococcota bacterium]
MRERGWLGVLGVCVLGTLIGCSDVVQYGGEPSVDGATPQGGHDDALGDEVSNGTSPGEPMVREEGLDFATCGPEKTWDVPSGSWFSGAGLFDISPNGALLVWSGEFMHGQIYNMEDGALEFQLAQPMYRHSMDAAWRQQLRAQWGEQSAGLYDMMTGELLLPLDAHTMYKHNMALSEDGAWAASYGCLDGSESQIKIWSVADNRLVLTVDLAHDCMGHGWASRPMMALTPGGDALLLAAGSEELVRVDLASGSWRSTVAHPPVDEEVQFWGYSGLILDMVIHPSGDRVATVGLDGVVRQWALPGLEPVGEEFEAGVSAINQDSYLPSTESPLAWSPDGTLLAYVSPEGDVKVRRLADGEEVFVQERFPLEPEAQQWEGNAPVFMRFTRDGGGFAVAFENRVVLWQCPERVTPAPGGEVEVQLTGPTQIQVGESSLFSAAAPDLGDTFHGYSFLVDGNPGGWVHASGEMEWQPTEPGTYTLTVEVTDGLRRGSVSRIVEVVP